MTGNKPWYLSRTLWGAGVAMFASLGALTGIHLSGTDQTSIVDAGMQIASAAGALIAIVGRLAADTTLR